MVWWDAIFFFLLFLRVEIDVLEPSPISKYILNIYDIEKGRENKLMNVEQTKINEDNLLALIIGYFSLEQEDT